MPRFHLNVFNDSEALGEDGMDLPDLNAGRRACQVEMHHDHFGK